MYYTVNVQFLVDFIGLVDYNILNKGAVSQMKPDRRQNKCYKNKRLTLPEQGRLFSIVEYHDNKGDNRTKHNYKREQVVVCNHST